MKWFNDARQDNFDKRFGMFVHFGIYALTEWHEQALWRREMQRDEYELLAKRFNPSKFDPDQWIDVAESAGMEYICLTSKHHDGYCLWDTKHTEYKITNSPYGEDLLAKLAAACDRRRMGLGIYYSLPDWHHPTYPNKGRHHEMFGPRADDTPDEDAYLDFVEAQVRELCTGYGPLVQFFWDVNVAEFHRPALNDLIRDLQPGILIDDRGPGPGDFVTPERSLPEGFTFTKPTIAVQSTGRESWAYRAGEDYYTYRFLTHSIDRFLAMGGNYQLNVGPKPDGTIGEHDVKLLARIGDWYRRVGEAFGDAEACSYLTLGAGADLVRYDRALLTRRGRKIYVHTPFELQTSGIMLHPIKTRPSRAILLNDGRELETVVDVTPWRWRERPALRILDLPADEITDEPLVVSLEFPESLYR
jgi:alpha-L-fucosidase